MKLLNNLIAMILLGKYLATAKKRRPPWSQKQFILGHRGARAIAPENTLISFKTAFQSGADGVEFDVCMSRDGVPVVIHDKTVDRTTNGHGKVQDLTFFELAKLDASKVLSNWAFEPVPSLAETLDLFLDGSIINVELKSRGHYSSQVFIEEVIEILDKHRHRLRLIVSSFDGKLLSYMRKAAPDYFLGLLLSPKSSYWPWALSFIDEIAPDALHLSPDLLNPLLIKLAQRNKIKLLVWTINDGTKAQTLFERGIDGIFTDTVPEMVQALHRE